LYENLARGSVTLDQLPLVAKGASVACR
jgi:hypothetical protein